MVLPVRQALLQRLQVLLALPAQLGTLAPPARQVLRQQLQGLPAPLGQLVQHQLLLGPLAQLDQQARLLQLLALQVLQGLLARLLALPVLLARQAPQALPQLLLGPLAQQDPLAQHRLLPVLLARLVLPGQLASMARLGLRGRRELLE